MAQLGGSSTTRSKGRGFTRTLGRGRAAPRLADELAEDGEGVLADEALHGVYLAAGGVGGADLGGGARHVDVPDPVALPSPKATPTPAV
ncbi:MAG: hypothetical protein R3F59_23450 [Myxococcota bacterium]